MELQHGSPKWVEEKYTEIAQAIFGKALALVRSRILVALLGSSALALLYLAVVPHHPPALFQASYFPVYHFGLVLHLFPRAIFILLLSPLIWLLLGRVSHPGLLVLPLALLFLDWEAGTYRSFGLLWSYCLVVLPLFWIAVSDTASLFASFLALSGVALLVSEYLGWRYPGVAILATLSFAPAFQFVRPVGLRILEGSARERSFGRSNRNLTDYLFSPVTYFYFLPVMSEDWISASSTEAREETVLQGITDVAVALLCILLSALLFKSTSSLARIRTFGLPLLGGFRMSLGYWLCSLSVFRAGVGVGRLFGYRLRDAAHFSILATSPAESWKRWSTYLYQWMLVTVFVPIQRRTGIIVLGYAASFFVLYLVHFPKFIPMLLFHGYASAGQQSWLILNLTYFMLQAAFLYLGYLTRAYWPRSERRAGWFGVIATQFGLALIHMLFVQR